MAFFNFGYIVLFMVSQKFRMGEDLKEIIKLLFQAIYIILLVYVIYQVLNAILGGTWATENIIIAGIGVLLAGMFTILTILINQGMKLGKIHGILQEHLRNHPI